MFYIVALSIWTLQNTYILYRLSTIPWIDLRIPSPLFWFAGAFLWVSYPLARILSAKRLDAIALPLEAIAAFWIGLAFLLLAGFLSLDLVTLGGFAFSRFAGSLRGAVALVAFALGLIGLVQWLRSPAVRSVEIQLPDLPASRDGLTVALVSDLHLGTLLGERWAGKVIDRVQALRADLIVLAGDTIDGDVERVTPMVPTLARLSAPLGVYAVAGNHDHYAGFDQAVALHEQAGFTMLHNQWTEPVEGLVLAGIDDLTATQTRGEAAKLRIRKALADAPRDRAVLLISHTPLEGPELSDAKVDLVLSGHTHGGQLWPFEYLVGLRHRHVAGLYQTGATRHLVGRGAGTWGPPMRLWARGEIWRITLRAGN